MAESHSPPPKKDQSLRRVYSDTSSLIPDMKNPNQQITTIDEEAINCECCGVSEDCTPTYITRIKSYFCNKWVCGLCAEAVKEKIRRASNQISMEEALESHGELCKRFNGTVRVNPKLSLAGAMREIAKKSSQRRKSSEEFYGGGTKIGRTMSCVARIDGC
ncbi:uncharacterized protein LOC109842831 [Asparagus officinalis]|uniref:uncharacterized protein LOC109842831 n=1 Tax=Asparagus officinalis TaxID=4686 RepID=UPI00098E801F|nr:uncharacterized protein LOC109842831 [Asparagus officinalis]